MPIRLRDSNAFVGRVGATTENASASVSGTHVAPPSRAGAVATQLGELTPAIVGQFQAAPNRVGTIATTLSGVTSNEFGTAAPPPIPNRTGTISTSIGVTSSIRGSVTLIPQPSTWWPNWPIMNTTCLQGFALQDSHDLLADKDLVIFQESYPKVSPMQARIDGIRSIRALRAPGSGRVRFIPHIMAQETWKVALSPATQSALEVSRDIITSATEGNENWFVHRVNQPSASGRVESNNKPDEKFQCNMAALHSGLNSLGENYAQAFWRKWHELLSNPLAPLVDELDGFFMDNFNQRPPDMWINNGATSITDHDFTGNGTIDSRTDFSSGPNAGGRMWAAGHLEFKSRMEARFPGFVLCPNAARWALDYIDGAGSPPLPFSASLFYQKFELNLREVSTSLIGITDDDISYTFTGGGSVTSLFRTYYIQEQFLMSDSANTLTGKGCVLMHMNGIKRVPIAADYALARFASALPLLVERGAPCFQLTGQGPFSLDETLIELGNPIGTRSMGTLNVSTGTFVIRSPEPNGRTVGAARFYWAEFEKGIVVIRGDAPTVGAYPSADAAISCTLPSAGVGKKWQKLNAASYTNPRTGRSTRGQDTSLNNGADVTAVALRPYHAVFVRRVNS